MAQSKVITETLLNFSNILKQNCDSIMQVKQSMDNVLTSFPWDDPVGRDFIKKYYEDLKPVEEKLVPNLASYSQYLDTEASIIEKYDDNDANSNPLAFVAGAAVAAGAFIKKGIDLVYDFVSQPGIFEQLEAEERERNQKSLEREKEIAEKLEKERLEKYKTEIFMAPSMGNGKIEWEDEKYEEEFKDWKNTPEAIKMYEDAQTALNLVQPDLKKGITYQQLEDVINGVIHLKPEEIDYYTTDIREENVAGVHIRHFSTNAYIDRPSKGSMSVCQAIGVAAHEGTHVWQNKVSKLSEKWSKPEFLKEEKNRKFLLKNKFYVDYYNKIRESMKNEEPYENRFHEKEARKVEYIIGKACTAYYKSTITPK